MREAIREAFKSGMTPGDVHRAVFEEHNEHLHDTEHAKHHALTDFRLPEKEWAAFKKHQADGGGVIDSAALLRDYMHACFNDDQESVWHMTPHIIKAWLKEKGHLEPRGEGVIMQGVYEEAKTDVGI